MRDRSVGLMLPVMANLESLCVADKSMVIQFEFLLGAES
jgi:hypothetical protein